MRQHRASTVVLRIPTPAWSAVNAGRVSQFRCATGNAPQLWKVPLPTLAVTYRRRKSADHWDYRLMMLLEIRREALGAITPDGLAAAGYSGDGAFARFRRDWTIHEKKRFEPLRTVFVYTVRPIQPGDLELAGRAVIEHLYGSYEEAQERPRTIQAQRRADPHARAIGGAVATGGR